MSLARFIIFALNKKKNLHEHDETGCKQVLAKKLGDVVSINVTALKSFVPGPDIHDGFAINCIPTEAIACMDVRVPPNVPLEDIENLFKEWTKEEGLSYSFYHKIDKHNVSTISDNNSWWNSLQSTFKELNKSIITEIFPAATDSKYYRNEGLPCYGFSPMNNTPILLHDHDEFINVAIFKEGIAVYERLIYNLANVDIE